MKSKEEQIGSCKYHRPSARDKEICFRVHERARGIKKDLDADADADADLAHGAQCRGFSSTLLRRTATIRGE